MKPTFIFLVRHGQSLGNVDKNIYLTVPDYKVELTDLGKEQAKKAASTIHEKLSQHSIHRAAMYCSPFCRTRQTAEPIRNLIDIDYKEDPRIREQEWGNYKDLAASLRIDKERERYGRFFYRMPDGESGADVYDRISTFLETIHRDFKNPDYPRATIIVSHGIAIRVFLMRWFHWSVEKYETIRNLRNCETIILEKDSTIDPVTDKKIINYKITTPLRTRSNA